MSASKKATKAARASPKAKARSPGAPRRTGDVNDATLSTNDVAVEQARAANALVAAMPFNATKKSEYGYANALSPPAGAVVEPASAALTASTQSEKNGTAKTGRSAVPGENATVASLDRVRVDAGGQALTTNQGVPISDNRDCGAPRRKVGAAAPGKTKSSSPSPRLVLQVLTENAGK